MSIGRKSILLAFALAHLSFGGSLAEREKDVTERSDAKTKKSAPEKGRVAYSGIESDFPGAAPSHELDDFFLRLLFGFVAYPFIDHDDGMEAAPGVEEGSTWSEPRYPPHLPGQATAPYIRADFNFQWAEEVEAIDGRLELGYKTLAFHARMTRFTDADDFSLDLNQYYALIRFGGCQSQCLTKSFEIGLGLGGAQHTGDVEDDTSLAFTIPIKYYPADWLGFEFRPAWYQWQEVSIGDYDLSVSAGYRFMQLRLGYRWLWDGGVVDVQSGPYAGLSASF